MKISADKIPWRRALAALGFLASGCTGAMPPLHEAALTGNTELIRAAVAGRRNLDEKYDEPSRGLEGNYARLKGLTPLMMAARAGQLEAARLLVEGGASLYAEANTQLPGEPKTAFDFAVDGGHVAVADYLWSRSDGKRFARHLGEQIASACGRLCSEKAGADARTNMALFLIGVTRDPDALGRGIGGAACYAPRPLEVLAFLEKRLQRFPGAALNCMAFQTPGRHRPLAERLAVVTWLLDHGADPNDRSLAWTPLMGAAAAPDKDMVELLLSRGADPNLRTAAGLTPIGAAANSCIHPKDPEQVYAPLEAQADMVERLARVSDPAVYASAEARSKLDLLGKCCARQPHGAAQQRICAPFGL